MEVFLAAGEATRLALNLAILLAKALKPLSCKTTYGVLYDCEGARPTMWTKKRSAPQ